MTSSEIRFARGVWLVFLPLYGAAIFFGLMGSRVIPLLIAVPFGLVAVISSSMVWPISRRLAFATSLAAVMEAALGVLMLGGPGSRLLLGAQAISLPGIPRALLAPSFYVALALPLAAVGFNLWFLRRLRPSLASAAG